jgi:hypothetical protein
MPMSRNMFDRQLSVRQLANLAIVAIVVIGLPYLAVGVAWAFMHSDHLGTLSGMNQLVSTLGEIVAWPVLLISDVNLV